MIRTTIYLLLYVSSIVAANVVLKLFGVQPVGFGLQAPAAVYVAGLAFVFRDYLHRAAGDRWARWTISAVVVGALLSAVVSPSLALASGLAFLFSELADLFVFAKLRARGFTPAAVVSNLVGILLDSLIFLAIAFGSFAFLPGQLVGKLYATLAFIAWRGFVAVRARRSPVPA